MAIPFPEAPNMSIPRLKPYQGPVILSYGFRPFFLLGSIYAALSVVLWIPVYYGRVELLTLFTPVDWHIHELYFGYLAAIITGFLFTAVPNWTGRMPLQGRPLLFLVMLWLTGRLAVSFSVFTGWEVALILDLLFLVAVGIAIAKEIVAGENWRNLKVLLPLAVLFFANLSFHIEAHFYGTSDFARRLAALAAVTLIILIGGRIIPSFTRNWLSKNNVGKLPAQFGRFDMASIGSAVLAIVIWVLWPDRHLTAILMIIAAISHTIRLSRWAGYRACREPLVIVLHLSYFFVPLGFAFLAASILLPDVISRLAGIHAWSIGAIGGMTLSVMVRASLGHTGQALGSGPATRIIFAAIFISVTARILHAFEIGDHDTMLMIAGTAWVVAFAGFAIRFGPALFSRKPPSANQPG